MKYAPIYIPTLNRFKHLEACLESLKDNTWACYTDVFVSVDYPPSDKYKEGWLKVKNYLENGDFSRFASFTIIERLHNLGASLNSKETRKQLLSMGYDRWIYSEDDIVFSPNFLEYMDKCLDYYYDDEDIIGVTGFSYPVDWQVSENSTCFKQMFNASMWGTGFWAHKREPVVSFLKEKGLKKSLRSVIKYKLYQDMIDTAQIEYFKESFSCIYLSRKNWCRVPSDIGIRAYLAVMRKYYITPVISKTKNIGFDGSGANCQNTKGSSFDNSTYRIDDSRAFCFVPNQLDNYRENRDRLNDYEYRSPSEMRTTRMLIKTSEACGIVIARLISLSLVPFEFLKIIKSKLNTR